MPAPAQLAGDVFVYRRGIVHCSVCVPSDMPRETVEELVNRDYPTGISSEWRLSKDRKFTTGEDNPCRCNDDESRLHYLMEC